MPIPMAISRMAMSMTTADTLPLLAWLSPGFPTGAYAYSHGLETMVERGLVRDVDALVEWVGDVLTHGAGRNDAILLRAAHTATLAGDAAALDAANALALALAPSRERHLETLQQGRAFAAAIRAAWPPVPPDLPEVVAYPVALGAVVAAHRLPAGPAAEGMLLAFAANLTSAAVRLVPLGQTDGQRAVARLLPIARQVARQTDGASLDDLGGCAIMADLAAIAHETLDGRLFRS